MFKYNSTLSAPNKKEGKWGAVRILHRRKSSRGWQVNSSSLRESRKQRMARAICFVQVATDKKSDALQKAACNGFTRQLDKSKCNHGFFTLKGMSCNILNPTILFRDTRAFRTQMVMMREFWIPCIRERIAKFWIDKQGESSNVQGTN